MSDADYTPALLAEIAQRSHILIREAHGDGYKLFTALGITDHEYFRSWVAERADNSILIGLAVGVDLVNDYVAVAMLRGMVFGYQLALLREEKMKES